jgi:hypothetical protein
MSSKNSDSGLPNELNDNWGSNYMMDGFWHDMEYGNGLQENPGSTPVPQPSTSGYSHLPDGVLMGNDCEPIFHDLPDSIEREDDGVDLANLEIVASYDPTSDPSALGVVDHEWLGEAYQDPSRLPQSPTDDGIDELEQAWGDRTDGIRRIDMCERVEKMPNLGEQRDNSMITQQLLNATVRSAMRRSAAGVSVEVLRNEAIRILGEGGFRHVAKAFKAIEEEHGLVGNVYVRASAYPGLHQGKWASSLKKTSGRARFLIAAEGEDCDGCATALGMRVIAHPNRINWLRALERYAPELRAAGKLSSRVASGNERSALRAAFLCAGTSPRMHIESTKPVQVMPADTVTTDDARRSFAAAPAKVREHIVDETPNRNEQAKLVRRLGSMVQARLITKEEAEKLCTASGSARSRLKVAELLAARTKRAAYSGATQGDPRVSISADEFAAAPVARQVKLAKTAADAEDGERRALLERFFRLQQVVAGAKSKVLKLSKSVSEGLCGARLRARVASLFDDREREIVSSILDPILVRGGFYDNGEKKGTREYEGPVLHEAVPTKHEKQASPREIAGAVRWALLQMNDGFAGDDLDHLLERRFSPTLLKAASTQIDQARTQHEALAGHLYVHASAYASAEGTKGCDEGALRHRANGIKHVLAMPRCSKCVFRNANNVCQKYNKELVRGVDAPVAEKYRLEMLAAHRASDHETTAELFSTPDILGDMDIVSEFGLHNGSLDDVSSEEVVYGGLDDVFFGGLEV